MKPVSESCWRAPYEHSAPSMGMRLMHLDEEQVERFLHRELGRTADTSAREHLAACPDCRRRVAQAEREEEEVYALLRHVDHPAPTIDASAVAARSTVAVAWFRWAASIVLTLGVAAAAYAAPGSPLPGWAKAVVDWISGHPRGRAPERGAAGIAVVPGRNLVILFTSSQAEGQAQVRLTDGGEVVVRAPTGAATFTTDADRLVIDNRGSSATFEIQIPRAAPRVEIWVKAVRVFLKEGAHLTGPSQKHAHRLHPDLGPGRCAGNLDLE